MANTGVIVTGIGTMVEFGHVEKRTEVSWKTIGSDTKSVDDSAGVILDILLTAGHLLVTWCAVAKTNKTRNDSCPPVLGLCRGPGETNSFVT